MTRAKTIMRNVEETTQHDNNVAVFASHPLICCAARHLQTTLSQQDFSPKMLC
jgi:hypothetical protein